jgi:hypothetical protein
MSNKNVKVGDIFYSSWGYDQTNIDYYMVTKLIGKTMVEIVAIESKYDEKNSNKYTDALLPYKVVNPIAQRYRRKVKEGWKGEPKVNIEYWRSAWKWDGKPKMATNYNYHR